MTEPLTEVIWTSYDAQIPHYGEARAGQLILLPADLARKFIEQGQATPKPSKGSKTKETDQ